MTSAKADALQGTLDLAVLKTFEALDGLERFVGALGRVLGDQRSGIGAQGTGNRATHAPDPRALAPDP